MIRRAFIVALLLIGTLCVTAQRTVDFIEEYIDFEIDNTRFYINGIYTFCNTSKKEIQQPIFFPFADEAEAIDSIRVTNLNTVKNIPFRRQERGISFTFMLAPRDTVNLNIFYRQKAAKTNTYIITSAKSWGKPLKKAVYTLKTPNDTRIESFSFAPDSQKQAGDKHLYLWEKENFSPNLDFVVVVEE
jgi:hypothetical protein